MKLRKINYEWPATWPWSFCAGKGQVGIIVAGRIGFFLGRYVALDKWDPGSHGPLPKQWGATLIRYPQWSDPEVKARLHAADFLDELEQEATAANPDFTLKLEAAQRRRQFLIKS